MVIVMAFLINQQTNYFRWIFFSLKKTSKMFRLRGQFGQICHLRKVDTSRNALLVIGPLQLLHFIYFFSGKPVDLANLMNPTGKDFDANESAVLALIMERSK